MGEFTLKKLRKLRRTYFLIWRTIGYVKWKKKALELFSSVHDLDTLARIMRRKKLAAEKISECTSTILIGGVITFIIKFILNSSSKITSWQDVINIFEMYPAFTIILFGCFFVAVNKHDSMSFYDECLTIIGYLDKCNTK